MIFLQKNKDILEYQTLWEECIQIHNLIGFHCITTIRAKTGMVGLLVIEFFCIRGIKGIYNKKTQGSFLTKVLFNGRGILKRKFHHFKITLA